MQNNLCVSINKRQYIIVLIVPVSVRNTSVYAKSNIIDVPGSIIGKYIKVRERHVGEDTILGEGIVLATYISQKSGNITVCLKIFTVNNEIKTIDIPARADSISSIYIETEHSSDCVKYNKDNDIIRDISNFCSNQCIFDCKDCSIAKYGIREVRE